MSDVADQAEAIAETERRLRLAAVSEAAERLSEGTVEDRDCRSCGDPIPRARLEAVPGADECVKCVGARERQRRAFR